MSVINKKFRDVQKKLSKVNMDFLEFVEKNPDALRASSFKMLDLNDKLFVLQPWPTFVNQTTMNEFQAASIKLFDLIKSIPKRIFNSDFKKISAYYQIPENLAKLQLEGVTDEYVQNLLGRGDFLMSPYGLKCLEYNVTANLGGWYVPLWESLYLSTPVISKFLKEYRIQIKNNNLIQSLIEHIIHSTMGQISADDRHPREMNILFVIRNFAQFTDNMGVYLDKLYKTSLQQNSRALKGEVFMADYHLLDIVDNYVYYKGKRIHTLIEMYNGVVSPEVMEVFKAGNVGLFNGPISELLSSKLNLALLSDYKASDNDAFSDEEKKIIDKYVPWSRKIIPGGTICGGKEVKMENFILSNKDRFVIKPSIGYGGKGVYIGQRVSERKWEVLIKTAFREKNWLVQEFVEVSPTLYQVGEEGCELHDMAWGFFVLGSQYAGAWARVLPQKDNKGVINCHQGATVSVIFQVDE